MTTLGGMTIIEHFPVEEVQKQAGILIWESIRKVHINLDANAALVPSNLGGCQHGHFGLTIRPAKIQTLTGYAFQQHQNPDIKPPGEVSLSYRHK
eukprot:10986199-Ditylum_brightwellii.AAC.1